MQSFFIISSLLFVLALLPHHVSSIAGGGSSTTTTSGETSDTTSDTTSDETCESDTTVTVTVTVTAGAASPSTINTNTCACPASSSSFPSFAAASSSILTSSSYAAASSSTILLSAYESSSSSTFSSTFGSSTSSSLSTSSPTLTSTTSTSPTLGVVQSAGGYNYVGCYTEPSNVRALPSELYADDLLTVEKCSTDCAGYAYFGVEYSRECWCADALNSNSQSVSASECDMLCNGNQFEYCGGRDRLNVYSLLSISSSSTTLATLATFTTTSFTTSTTTTITVYPYLGCYSEATNSRALKSADYVDYSQTGMTIQKCGAYCQGYALFGLEFGGECYCGEVLQPGSATEPESDCYMPCDGNSFEICGGPDRLSIYYYE